MVTEFEIQISGQCYRNIWNETTQIGTPQGFRTIEKKDFFSAPVIGIWLKCQ